MSGTEHKGSKLRPMMMFIILAVAYFFVYGISGFVETVKFFYTAL